MGLSIASLSLSLSSDEVGSPRFYYAPRYSHAMCHASVVNAYISREMYVANARYCTSARILFARSRRSGVSFLILLLPFLLSLTPGGKKISCGISHARVTGAVWSARHANATRSSYVSAGFQKCRSGTAETPRRGRAAAAREFMTTNSSVTRSLGDGTRSGFVGERGTTFHERGCAFLSLSFSHPLIFSFSPLLSRSFTWYR